MIFVPHIINKLGEKIQADIVLMSQSDADETTTPPEWQTDWNSDYIRNSDFLKYALKIDNELVALAAYEISNELLVVHIQYMESHPESNPTIIDEKKYYGIGKVLIAFGIKLSIDSGFNGDVILAAKTSELKRHYIEDFDAVPIPYSMGDGAQMLLISDAAALNIFKQYLE